jgi:MYXO-CTERM domain-containing protein
VAVSGDTVVAGASFDNDRNLQAGSAYVFQRSDMSWSQQAKLFAPDAAYRDRFGSSIAVSGDAVLVGVPYNDVMGDKSGAVHAFDLRFASAHQCTDADQCGSGFCADFVCCDSACDEPGKACGAAKKGSGEDGVCGPIEGGRETSRYSCAAAPGSGVGSPGAHLLVALLALAARSRRRRSTAKRALAR